MALVGGLCDGDADRRRFRGGPWAFARYPFYAPEGGKPASGYF